MPLDTPITRREYHLELMIVWAFVVLATTATLESGFRWTFTIVPLGALGMVALHAIALRRGAGGRPKNTPGTESDV
ncbi:MAG: hypothetical protein WD801_12810 [Gemmatimonadaceae bacterium]